MAAAAAAPCFRFRPTRLFLPAGDRLFEEGDVQRHLYLRLLPSPGDPPTEEEEEGSGGGPGLRCPWEGCGRGPFASLASLEHHYAWAHRSACAACGGRPFPSPRLLRLHLRENHDPLLTTTTAKFPSIASDPVLQKTVRKQASSLLKLPFQCLVEGCPEAFQSPSERKEHLVAQHRYPEDFRFLEDEGPPRRRRTGGQSTSAKGRKAQSMHGGDSGGSSGGSSSVSVVPMDVAQDQEEVPPAATDAMEVGPGGRAEEHQDEEEVAAFPQVPRGGSVSSEKLMYRPRVPAAICFGQGASRAFEGQRRRKV